MKDKDSPFYQLAIELNGVVFLKQKRRDRYFRVAESNSPNYPLNKCVLRISDSFDLPSSFSNEDMMNFLANHILQHDEVELISDNDMYVVLSNIFSMFRYLYHFSWGVLIIPTICYI
ncbi:hypothetical protein EON65_12870 [archaeon]|nr:MAG: hypothetical protein EON65_12870 [archaeon]